MFGFEIYKGEKLVFEVKIYKPDKNGDLQFSKTIKAKDCSDASWNAFNKGNYRTGMRGNSGVKYKDQQKKANDTK